MHSHLPNQLPNLTKPPVTQHYFAQKQVAPAHPRMLSVCSTIPLQSQAQVSSPVYDSESLIASRSSQTCLQISAALASRICSTTCPSVTEQPRSLPVEMPLPSSPSVLAALQLSVQSSWTIHRCSFGISIPQKTSLCHIVKHALTMNLSVTFARRPRSSLLRAALAKARLNAFLARMSSSL
jgi:hypothetical protein